ncbi:DUF1330 domain-containing protein [Aquihabitans sp. McL0605]|uniref:DUF1330 domain-containing protein n=1 Tax=Aquihabitans sp. McL0605 TaxID=3415671 RepID=UPI003CFA0EEE
MGKAYVIFTETIHDEEGIAKYNELAIPTIGASGARVLAFDDNADVLEGEWPGRTVILEFDTPELAREWYDSPAYQEAAAVRQAATTSHGVIINGF